MTTPKSPAPPVRLLSEDDIDSFETKVCNVHPDVVTQLVAIARWAREAHALLECEMPGFQCIDAYDPEDWCDVCKLLAQIAPDAHEEER